MPWSRRFVAWSVLVVTAAAIEWVRAPAGYLVVVGGVAAMAALWVGVRDRSVWGIVSSALAAFTMIAAGAGTVSLTRIDRDWPEVLEVRTTEAEERLRMLLDEAVTAARQRADRAAEDHGKPQRTQFRQADVLTRTALETGLVNYDVTGNPLAWGGRHRTRPEPVGPAYAVEFTPLYTVLEARTETAQGWSVAQLLLDADSIVAPTARSLTAAFAERTGFGVRFYPPVSAPMSPTILDFGDEAGIEADLFSVELVVPSPEAAQRAAHVVADRRVAALLFATILGWAVFGPTALWRFTALVMLVWGVGRADLGLALGITAPFSPEIFSRETLGVLTSSAGMLALVSLTGCVGAIGLWQATWRRGIWGWPLAAMLVVGAPYALREVGRGIVVPRRTPDISMWLTWELTLALVTGAILLTAAAVIRPKTVPPRTPLRLFAGIGWAVLAAVVGLYLWDTGGAWPDWYEFIWLPAAMLVVTPAPRRSMIVAIAIVAGTGATLITWESSVRGRMTLAEADINGLRLTEDPEAQAVLESVADAIVRGTPVENAADLYRLWRTAERDREGYPARLWVLAANGDLQTELPLADLGDFRLSTVRTSILARDAARGPEILRQPRGPGAYYLLVAPLRDGNTLAIGLGPRSETLSGGVLGPFLRGERRSGRPPYALELRPSPFAESDVSDALAWRREGWQVHGDVLLAMEGVGRGAPVRLHALVEVGGPVSVLVRGALLVLLNVVLLALTAIAVAAARGELNRGVVETIRQVAASYRARLTLVLSGFFILPAVSFSLWSLGRLGNEERAAGDLVIRQTLVDAWEAGNLRPVLDEPDPNAVSRQLEEVAKRVQAELFLYKGSNLFSGSAPLLRDLGLVEPFLPPSSYQTLIMRDAIEMADEVEVGSDMSRMGYRRVTSDPPPAIIAAVRLFEAAGLQGGRRDLAFVLLLGTVAGFFGSFWLAGLVAQQLARPVAALRDAAIAVGRGETPDLPTAGPTEFRAVMDAFSTMASDVQRSHDMLEAARRRTARVLQNVATGVIAVDKHLVVGMANSRAEQIVGERLEPGMRLDSSPAAWQPLWTSVRDFLEPNEDREDVAAPQEFDVGDRRIRMQIARLKGGAVVALDDTTELATAERVLAWGEMARQIAHEIKNPLTPLRLGLQHLERVYRHRPEEFGQVFADTGARLQAEIARLDAIARAFSRFGAPQGSAEQIPLEDVSLDECVDEVLALYKLGEDNVDYRREGGSGGIVRARRDEVKEVLVNLVENARNARARNISLEVSMRAVRVRDDGCGIPAEVLPRIFEPRFSTTTSGAGLGLAIVQRLVESWGALIDVTSAQDVGTTFTVRWSAAAEDQDAGGA